MSPVEVPAIKMVVWVAPNPTRTRRTKDKEEAAAVRGQPEIPLNGTINFSASKCPACVDVADDQHHLRRDGQLKTRDKTEETKKNIDPSK